MEKELLINAVLHQAFTQNTYSPNNDTYTAFKEFFPHKNFLIAAFSLPEKHDTNSYQQQFVSAVPKYAIENSPFPIWNYKTENDEQLLFINFPDENEPAKWIDTLYIYFAERYSCRTFWGISRACSSLSELSFAKKEALTALSISLKDNNENITAYTTSLNFKEAAAQRCFYPETAKQLLIKGLKTGDLSLIDFIITILHDENILILALEPDGLIQLNSALIETLNTFSSPKNNFSSELLQLNHAIASYEHNPSEYFSLLIKLCHVISEKLNGQKLSKKNTLMLNIQNYIREHYKNPNLNLSGIAQHFNISEGYLSVIFKETAGICFAEYLEKIRIDKSCVLLATSDYAIHEISDFVGYNSVYSFRRAFKRILNISPSQYREQHNK